MCASEREYREQPARSGTSSEREEGAVSASLASDFHRQKRGMEEIGGQGEHQGPATHERPLCPSSPAFHISLSHIIDSSHTNIYERGSFP